MAYDRYDRDERPRWFGDRSTSGWRGDERGSRHHPDHHRGDQDERGFFERAGDEISSWFGGSERDDRRHYNPEGRYGRPRDFDRGEERDRSRRELNEGRGAPSDLGWDRDDRGHGYRPMTGDYGRYRERDHDRVPAAYGRDEYRRTSFAAPPRDERDFDPHYRSWRDRHMSELDRDYDEFRREHQSQFENDFGGWREKRQQKRSLLGQIREHMEVLGTDGEHVGTVDKVAGDRIILAKSDPESGGAHHSLSCSDIDRIEDNRVILDCKADEARRRWRDESRSRALFEREDQGEMGPGILDRSFSGTYR
jgi:hypothetical protein